MNDFFYKKLGSRIAERRKILELTQEKLAELSGLSRNYIGKIERAEKKMSLDSLRQIASALDCQVYELVDGL